MCVAPAWTTTQPELGNPAGTPTNAVRAERDTVRHPRPATTGRLVVYSESRRSNAAVSSSSTGGAVKKPRFTHSKASPWPS